MQNFSGFCDNQVLEESILRKHGIKNSEIEMKEAENKWF
jgi:hypothetical protein